MNESNLEYLKKSLDYLGFGSMLNEVLESAIRREIPNFSVGISTYFEPQIRLGSDFKQKDTVQFTLDFNRAKDSDSYFLNDYTAILNTHNGIERRQEFNLERDHRITASQAYRLLLGAALHKEVLQRGDGENSQAEKKDVWMKLNLDLIDSYGRHPLTKIHSNYGFDLEAAIDKYPISWQKENERAELMESLKKGAFGKVAMEIEGKLQFAVVSANPRMKNLDVYDEQMSPVRNDRIFGQEPKKIELSGQNFNAAGQHEAFSQQAGDAHQQSRGRGRG